MDSFRRSLTFGEADKKRSAFSKQKEERNQMEQPLLNVSMSSDDMKRHSYHGSSSYDKSSFEDSSIDAAVRFFLHLREICAEVYKRTIKVVLLEMLLGLFV